MSLPLRTLIADDHGLVRSGLRQMLSLAPDVHVVGEAGNGAELLDLLDQQPADVALMDMAMPGESGVVLIRRLAQLHPRLAVLVVSMHDESQIVTRALRAGAVGYITKDADPELLIEAVRRVGRGGRFIDPALVDSVVFPPPEHLEAPHQLLSPRELQILEMIATGLPLGSIADALQLSPKTVSTHKMRLMAKLGVDNNVQLMRYVIQHGIARVG
jgi:DNA-binding NarL/FixJ family response regulator